MAETDKNGAETDGNGWKRMGRSLEISRSDKYALLDRLKGLTRARL